MTTQPHPARMDPETVRAWLSQDDGPRLLDVRSPAEFETAHIPGSYNVPLHLLREHRAAAVTNTRVMGNLISRLPFSRTPGCDVDTVVRQLTDTRPVQAARAVRR